MVKFEKLLEGELVQEWREAYVDYRQLKHDLKQIKEFFVSNQYDKPILDHNISQEHMLSSFPSPLADFRKLKHHLWSLWSQGGINMIIHQRRLDISADGEDLFETELLGTDSRTDVQKSFFERLDTQLNKVNKFYRSKEQEYMYWASQLSKQIVPLCQKRKGLSHRRVEDASAEDTSVSFKCVGTAMINSESDHSGKVLRGSFTELYQGLGLLKDYCCLNLAAFGKILKKHDKITGQKVSNVYLRAVECSYFATSDMVTKLMEKVESLFIEHFTNGSRREALAYLKPTRQDNRVKLMYRLGLFSGTSVSLFTVFILLSATLHQRKLPAGSSYSQFDFHIFSTFALLFLHLYMYGFNVFIWQRVHINYAVILEFSPGKGLGFRNILLLTTAFTTIMLSGMVMQLVFYSTAAKTSVHPLTIMLLNSSNPWLRDSLVLRQRSVYFVSVGINSILRLVWLFSVLHLQDNLIDHDAIDFLFASLEVFRRGLWNFFRLENEHLKNVAKYTAIKEAIASSVNLRKEIV
ncbi:hypothetical protein L7F22_024600 [Adiantum nelumboides]|nr:hypothetical protein [Adiantum nelumboides]